VVVVHPNAQQAAQVDDVEVDEVLQGNDPNRNARRVEPIAIPHQDIVEQAVVLEPPLENNVVRPEKNHLVLLEAEGLEKIQPHNVQDVPNVQVIPHEEKVLHDEAKVRDEKVNRRVVEKNQGNLRTVVVPLWNVSVLRAPPLF